MDNDFIIINCVLSKHDHTAPNIEIKSLHSHTDRLTHKTSCYASLVFNVVGHVWGRAARRHECAKMETIRDETAHETRNTRVEIAHTIYSIYLSVWLLRAVYWRAHCLENTTRTHTRLPLAGANNSPPYCRRVAARPDLIRRRSTESLARTLFSCVFSASVCVCV